MDFRFFCFFLLYSNLGLDWFFFVFSLFCFSLFVCVFFVFSNLGLVWVFFFWHIVSVIFFSNLGMDWVLFLFFLKLKDQPLEAFFLIKALLAKQVLKHLF